MDAATAFEAHKYISRGRFSHCCRDAVVHAVGAWVPVSGNDTEVLLLFPVYSMQHARYTIHRSCLFVSLPAFNFLVTSRGQGRDGAVKYRSSAVEGSRGKSRVSSGE